MTVIRDVWGGDDPTEPGVETYSEAVTAALLSIPEHRHRYMPPFSTAVSAASEAIGETV